MKLDEYQEKAKSTDTNPEAKDWNDPKLIYKVLGLSGEAGETVDKFKKILRDKDGVMSEDDKMEIVKELGDVLWYLAIISERLGVKLSDVARINNEKLASRAKRNSLHGEGDNR